MQEVPKSDELRANMESGNPDILCIVELWLASEISDRDLETVNYRALQLDPEVYSDICDGGTIMYHRVCRVLALGSNNLELLVVSVFSLGSSYKLIILFYHPPSSNMKLLDSLCTVMQRLSHPVYNSFVLIGDFIRK